jgi:hypothetical protein
MSSTRIAYSQHHDATAEAEVSVLASIYKLAISRHARKEATGPGSPDDGTKIKEDSAFEHHSR